MSLLTSITKFFALRDDDEFDDEIYDDDGKPKIVAFSDAKSARKVGVSLFHPKHYDDVTEIADNLRARLLVVINLIGADRAMSQRVIDFLSGVVYTLDGKMQRLSEGMFLFVPSNVQVNAREPQYEVGSPYEAW